MKLSVKQFCPKKKVLASFGRDVNLGAQNIQQFIRPLTMLFQEYCGLKIGSVGRLMFINKL